MTTRNFCGRTRREMLWQTGSGFAGLAMTAMMDRDGFLNSQAMAADGATEFRNPLAAKEPHFAPKAKNVIFLYMYGGPRDRKSTRLNSSHLRLSRMPSSA